MENCSDDFSRDVSRFSEDLKLFKTPIPVAFKPKKLTTKLDKKTSPDQDFSFERDRDFVKPMQNKDPSRSYTPTAVYKPGYATVEGIGVNNAAHGDVGHSISLSIGPTGGLISSPAAGGMIAGKGPQAGGRQAPPPYSNPINTYSTSVEINRGAVQTTPKMLSGVQGATHQIIFNAQNAATGPHHQSTGVGHVPVPKAGPQLVPKPGSNYSSPRSSIGSYDSKSSSPRTSLVNPPPPPPYDYQRHGSPHSSNLASPRSSVSAASYDSKHSSPRTSMASIGSNALIYDKYPSPRGSLVHAGDKFHSPHHHYHQQHHQGNDGHLMNNVHSTDNHHPAARSPGVSLLDRYNEPAPPPPYNEAARYKTGLTVHHVSPASSKFTVQQFKVGRQPQGTFTITQQHQGDQRASANINISATKNAAGTTPLTISTTMPMTVNQTSQNAVHVPQKAAPLNAKALFSPQTRLQGLNYETIPSKQSQADVERKLAALTQQLENEMRMSGSPSGSRQDLDTIPSKPPPPYHGPHNTEPLPGGTYNPPSYTSSPTTVQQQNSPIANSGSPTSPVNMSTSNIRTPLPFQVTPPQPKGPTEAEKKIEALTQELENQMEKHPQGDYFGEYYTCL